MDPSTKRQREVLNEQVWWILIPLIIAVATAVLFPHIARYRERARLMTCQRNLKSVSLWTLTYAQEHDGLLPPGPDWVAQMQGYVKNRKVLVCPADRRRGPVSYVFNHDLFGADLDTIEDPHTTVLLYEGDVGQVVNRHNAGANYAFADGFVDWRQKPPPGLAVEVAEEP